MLLEAKDIVKQYGDFYALKKANISVPKIAYMVYLVLMGQVKQV